MTLNYQELNQVGTIQAKKLTDLDTTATRTPF